MPTCSVCGSTDGVHETYNIVRIRRDLYCVDCTLRRTEAAADVQDAIAEHGVSSALFEVTVWDGTQRVDFAEWYQLQIQGGNNGQLYTRST